MFWAQKDSNHYFLQKFFQNFEETLIYLVKKLYLLVGATLIKISLNLIDKENQ